MGLLILFILATLSSSAASLVVLADSSYCIHLRCEWRGVGKHCKPANFRQPSQQDGIRIPLLTNDESEASMSERIQAEYPVNTFTVTKDVDVGEQCKRRWLWCNAAWMYVEEDYESFLKFLQKPAPYAVPPKLQCRPSFPTS